MYFPRTSAQLNIGELKSVPKPDIAVVAAADFVKGKPGEVQAAVMTVAQRVAALTQTFQVALGNVAANRKQIYNVLLDLKEHFQEYGFRSAAAAVENVCKRSKKWANCFISEIEAELEISQVAPNGAASPDSDTSTDKKDSQSAPAEGTQAATEPPPAAPQEPEPAKPPIDVSGCVIPQHLLEDGLRERHKEVTEAAHWASKLKTLFESIQNDHDPLFVSVKASGNVQTFMNGAASMRYAISECLPEVVCPQCDAKSKTCHLCHGSGWISAVRWNREWVKSVDSVKQVEVRRRAAIKSEHAT